MLNKRLQGRNNRKSLTEDIRTAYSKKICEYVQQMITNTDTVMLYNSIDGEVDLSFLNCNGHKILFPRVEGDIMVAVEGISFEIGSYGIKEPVGKEYSGNIDAVIVPMCAFDKKMNRLGFGKGYYDRFLSNKNVLKIGVAFSCQETDEIITKETDVKMDYIITEKEILRG